MAITTHTLGVSYLAENQLPNLLKQLESYEALPYRDTKGIVTIGIGINIGQSSTDKNLALVLDYLGVTVTASIVQAFRAILQNNAQTIEDLRTALNTELNKYVPGKEFKIENEADAKVLKIKYITGYDIGLYKDDGAEKRLDAILSAASVNIGHDTKEYLALMSLYFNTPALVGAGLVGALADGNRAEAWYQIRYASNGDRLPGIAKRRYIESAIFGLYNEGTTPENISDAEAKQVMQMYTAHREKMAQYESKYATKLAAAQLDLNSAGFNTTQASTLSNSLNPAKNFLITKYITDEASITNKPVIDGDVLVGTLGDDLANDKSGLKGTAKNDLIFGEGGDDILEGGDGNDVLYGGAGNDTLDGGKGNDTLIGGEGTDIYIWHAGDHDTIIDSDKKGWIRYIDAYNNTTNLLLGTFVQEGTSNIWKHTLANGQVVTFSHNSPWRMTMPDGSILELGEDFTDGDFGINIVESTPTNPEITLNIAGDFKPEDFDPASAGIQTQLDDLGNVIVTNEVEPDRADFLKDSAGNDHISAGGGDDFVYLHRGGDNWVQGGNGSDIIDASYASSGKDLIEGQAGADILVGGADDDTIYSGDKINIDQAITQGATATANSTKGDWLDGGAGEDTLIGTATADMLMGGGGDDIMVGGGGDDTFYGDGKGVNIFRDWTIQREIIPQSDHTDYKVTINYAGMNESSAAEAGNDNILGGAGNDWIFGGGGDDVIDGGNDDDVLFGGEGMDLLDGGDGNDVLVGNEGDDYLIGGEGNDKLYGTSYDNQSELGKDFLDGGNGDDSLSGYAGDDLLLGGAGKDALFGGAGNDILDGGTEDDFMNGEAGDDLYRINTLNDHDSIEDTSGNDTLAVGIAWDAVTVRKTGTTLGLYWSDDVNKYVAIGNGTAGAIDNFEFSDKTLNIAEVLKRLDPQDYDNVTGGETALTLSTGGALSNMSNTGTSSDTTYQIQNAILATVNDAGGSADIVDFGVDVTSGQASFTRLSNDDLLITLSTGAEITIKQHFVADNTHRIESIQFADNVIDTATLDSLLPTIVQASQGNDTLLGTTGDDELYGLAGNDTLVGGAGNDLYIFAQGDGTDTVVENDATSGNQDTLLLVDIQSTEVSIQRIGADLVISSTINQAANQVADKVIVQAFFTNTANEIEQFSFSDGVVWNVADIKARIAINGTAGDDLLQGYSDSDRMYGLGGNDQLQGNAGDDLLDGGAGNDTLFGQAGNDTLDGGIGDDVLQGNAGDDVYLFNLGGGRDVVWEEGDTAGDVLRFGADITASDIVVYKSGVDLVLSHINGLDQVKIANWYVSPTYQLKQFEFADGTIWNGVETGNLGRLRGTAGDDVINGTAQNETLYGMDGNDTLYGGGGQDTFIGGNGSDRLYGSSGADMLLGEAGNDILDGGGGTDTFVGGKGNDDITGSYGYADTYVFALGDGADIINVYDSYSRDTLRFETDILSTDISAERVGNNLVLRHQNGTDSVTLSNWYLLNSNSYQLSKVTFTADGVTWNTSALSTMGTNINHNYFLNLGDGAKTIEDWGGYDTLTIGNAIGDADIVISRVGQNLQLAHVNGVDKVTVKDWFSDLNKQIEIVTFAASGTVLTKEQIAQNFLTLTGTSGDDVIYGSDAYGETIIGLAGNDTIYAGAGDDQVTGDAGNDIVYGAAGKDKITGGTGNDTLYGGEDYDTYYFNQGDGQDTIIDTTYNELIFGNGLLSQFNPIWGGSSQDTVFQFGTDSVRIKLGSTVTPKFITNGTAQNDSLTGGTYGDYIYGLGGNDTIVGGSGADWLYGGDGDDILDGSFLTGANDQETYGSDSADFYVGGKGNDTLNGNSQADTYYFNLGDGNDVIIEGSFFSNGQWFSSFQDSLVFGKDITLENIQASELNGDLVIKVSASDSVTIKNWFGDYKARVDYIKFDDGRILDTSAIGTLAYTKRGTAGDDVLTANSNGTWGGALYGEAGNDTLNGGSGSDQLHGGSGNDVLNGGSGNDMYYFERGGGQDQIIDSSGTDKVYFDASITAADISLSRNANDLVLTVNNAGGTLSIKDYFATTNNIVESFIFTDGSSLPSTLAIQDSFLNIRGTSADDDLTGTAYIDMMFGADGNDVLRGLAGNDTLYGNAGDDNLDGGLGNDTMVGAIGNDVYFVDSLSDVVTELVNEGTDTVSSAINYTLGTNVENLTLTGSAVSGTGNELDNVFRGNSIANTFAGGIGNDSYYLGTGDTVTENTNAGTDTVYTDATYTLGTNIENGILIGTATVNLTGNAADNVLTGNAAANTLSGGAGSDTLIGAQGNDIYILDVATDIVIENLNEGNDTVQIAYATAAATALTAGTGQFSNIENITVTGTGSYNLTGDAGDNTLIGNASANVLTGNAGNDVLNGMGGADTMTGGLGNDVYTVDMLTDSITESLNEGIDLVNIAIATKSGTYTLGNNIENATITSTVAYKVTGNALDNIIIGNAAANTLTGGAGNDTLDGGAGVDTMVGGAGDDIYIVDATRDVVTEAAGAGNDTVKSAVTYTLGATSNLENLILTGATAINATGNAYANLLMGNAANNVLTDTAGGNDILQGLAGVDTFNDTTGNNLFDGGLGNDLFTAGAGRDIIIGGQGNDTITTGTGYDVIVFNKGDGQDIINASTGADNTISLGGNFAYSDLSLTKTGNDLILKMGSTDQITFKDWYVGTTNHSVVNLQVIAEAMTGFNLGGSDVLRDNNVENFNFANIVAAFDAAGSTANWQLTDSLLTTHLQAGSDSAAIGGDMAYQYGKNGNLSGMGLFNAQSVIGAASFGQAAQALNNPTAWQAETVKLG